MPDTYLVQCSSCGARNRLPHEKAGKRGTCGACGAPLVPSHAVPIPATDATWDREVLGSRVPTIVEVWSPQCGVCSQYEVSVRHMAVNLFGKARVMQLNAEQNPATARRYGIRGVPTVLLFRDGRLVATLLGPQGERGLRERLGV
ncbi:MAG: thioredoxin domain-containing protein [Deferrisomatales bacterium]|nr:thioredoxin domain-containing protein [Deferrisomatales bacterium]